VEETQLTFEEIAKTLGMNESLCSVSLSLPIVRGDVMCYRAYCFADLLIQRFIHSGQSTHVIGGNKAEVKKIISLSADLYIALIQFENQKYLYPMALKTECLSGRKYAIVQRLRKVERELDDNIRVWSSLIRNGSTSFYDYGTLLRKMKLRQQWSKYDHQEMKKSIS
jgi:hypothetical protein